MKLRGMKTNLHVLCPLHFSEMIPTDLQGMIDNRPYSKFCYACPEPLCAFNYDDGYFTSEGRRIRYSTPLQLRCSHDGFPMYISKVQSHDNELVWECTKERCNKSVLVSGQHMVVSENFEVTSSSENVSFLKEGHY